MRLSFEYDKMPDDCCECPCFDAQYCACSLVPGAIDKSPLNCPLRIEEPVRHGKWITIDKNVVQCPACRNFLDMRGVNAGRGSANYCPNCGTKMDLEE